MKHRKAIVLLLMCITSLKSFAQIDTLIITPNNLLLEKLKEKQNKYLVYIEKPDGSMLDISIWERSIRFSTLNNKKVIVINQQWKNQKQQNTRTIYSVNKRDNFQPIYHYSKNGTGEVEAYSFIKGQIIGTDSIANNIQKEFKISTTNATMNWELDLETYQLLPYQLNRVFKIHFYHPGSKKLLPNYYNYKVVGEERIKLFNNSFIDCWILKIQQSENSTATYWIDKKTQEVIKMLETFGAIKRYKIKI